MLPCADVMIAGKTAFIAGYGDVGKGCASAMKVGRGRALHLVLQYAGQPMECVIACNGVLAVGTPMLLCMAGRSRAPLSRHAHVWCPPVFVFPLQAAGARVIVSEIDPICALQVRRWGVCVCGWVGGNRTALAC